MPATADTESSAALVDERGVVVDSEVGGALSVYFDGRRVWSFVPSRDGRTDGSGRTRVRWPSPLRPYLDGEAEVSVRTLDADEELYSSVVRFGSGAGRITIAKPDGTALTMDKGGHLTSLFAGRDTDQRGALVDAMSDALAILHELDVPAFLAFGGLLGAVREGRLIDHDSDGDLVYLARSTHPVDIIMESLELERAFIERGWHTRRMSGGDFKLQIPVDEGVVIGCDVFTAFYRADELFIMPSIRTSVPVDALLPTGEVVLEGRTITAPRLPETLLEATYGSSWRVPDPSFHYAPSHETRRILGGLMRGERKHQRYWDEFYWGKASSVPSEPSPFARWVAEQEPDRGALIEIGSGTGRDSLWFAEQGFDVVGTDYSRAGVAYAERLAEERASTAQFRALNLYDLRHILVRGAVLARARRTDVVYARFLVHAVEPVGRQNLYALARTLLAAAAAEGRVGKLYLEFRTERTEHTFGEHYRRFVRPEVVCDELESYGFGIAHVEEAHGLAVHKTEDPLVSRIVATRGPR